MNTPPRRAANPLTDKGYVPVYSTAVVDQRWDRYTPQEHATWGRLFERQRSVLQGRACEEFLVAQDAMGMIAQQIPRFDDLNVVLGAATGWQLVSVEGLLPELTFFEHLANRRFPVTWWIRRPEQLDYLAEPDLFHDLFGHVPLLMDRRFADYMQAYGRGGVKAHRIGPDALVNLTRLYWYTVEFGLINTPQGLRIYGSGIVSSRGESLHALESDAPNRIGFDLMRVMRTRYRIDDFQKTYFVIDSFDALIQATAADFTALYTQLQQAQALPAGRVQDHDRILHRGTGAGWADAGDV
ncbi:phenylalanine 4-monooxygenase [Pseudoxanthomonas spadix BD-a59]|uniref:Phenylalanine-4-hydroxylase n=1 Tax=Pseudoxanthomonas spadix (strain BD-a59) TaxID=1045855 RepID=G7UU95_PSEUP|nr:phenylalanine 4-monooxygenase [Pseudoxanthomonas spadix]AER54984.1 phenylalanine 4-monooxygenase [Pseudoxanthomonas spadix BD-a59]